MAEDLGLERDHNVEQLVARVAELEAQVLRLQGDPSLFQKLRPYGFNPRQAKTLVLLARQHPVCLSREAISDFIGGTTLKSIDVLVCKIRRVIDDKQIPGTVETIHRQGYRLNDRLAAWVRGQIGESGASQNQLPLPFN